jgi:hypothetical protein
MFMVRIYGSFAIHLFFEGLLSSGQIFLFYYLVIISFYTWLSSDLGSFNQCEEVLLDSDDIQGVVAVSTASI